MFDDSDEEGEAFSLFSNSVKKQIGTNSEKADRIHENENSESESGSNSGSDMEYSEEEEIAVKKPKLSRTSSEGKSGSFNFTGADVTDPESDACAESDDDVQNGRSDISKSVMEDSDDDVDEEDDSNSDEDSEGSEEEEEDIVEEADSESDEEDGEEEGHLKWKAKIAASAAESFKRRKSDRINYRKLIYGKGLFTREYSNNFLFIYLGDIQ